MTPLQREGSADHEDSQTTLQTPPSDLPAGVRAHMQTLLTFLCAEYAPSMTGLYRRLALRTRCAYICAGGNH